MRAEGRRGGGDEGEGEGGRGKGRKCGRNINNSQLLAVLLC